MYLPDKNDTIIALSTPPFPGGIAIIRISGKDAIGIFKKLFKPISRNTASQILPTRMLIRGDIVNPFDNKQIIDESLGVVFLKPNSYTGEDMAEIHCHGNPFIARKIIELAISLSHKNNIGVVRPAERGEFTYRSFLNGKIDLVQAEAVLSVIEARSEKSLSSGLSRLKGKLSDKAVRWKEELISILSLVEFSIDMPEDATEQTTSVNEILTRISSLKKSIDEILALSASAYLYEGDIPVVIVGKPNAGKSSLFNALAREELAIVTPIAGTTRDIISERLHWDGLTWKVSDTAGISSIATDDLIEEIGQKKALKAASETFAVIFVLDGSKPIDEDDKLIVNHLRKQIEEKKVIATVNKSDLPLAFDIKEARHTLGLKSLPLVKISAARNEGIDELKSLLSENILNTSSKTGTMIEAEEIIVGNVRQKQILERCSTSLKEAIDDFNKGMEIVAHHLKTAAQSLEELTGEKITTEEILTEIFSKFCVGK